MSKELDGIDLLEAAGVGWKKDDGTFRLNMNDTFAWACADLEDVPAEEMDEVARLFTLWGTAGLIYWVVERRGGGDQSEFRDVNRWVRFVRQEEDLKKREPSSSKRAYMDWPE